MSDGPHKSLPLQRHWKAFAERAATAAYAPEDVAVHLPHTLTQEYRDAPIKQVCDILGGGAQSSLFPADKIGQLAALRNTTSGDAASRILIDCAVEAVERGLVGDTAKKSAVKNALDESARSAFRSTEEHYQRQAGSKGAEFIRDRLHAARQQSDLDNLASDLLSGKGGSKPAKKSGIDEGPPLS